MLRLTVDTSGVIHGAQAQQYGLQIDDLVDLARRGQIGLWITTAFAVDQETARPTSASATSPGSAHGRPSGASRARSGSATPCWRLRRAHRRRHLRRRRRPTRDPPARAAPSRAPGRERPGRHGNLPPQGHRCPAPHRPPHGRPRRPSSPATTTTCSASAGSSAAEPASSSSTLSRPFSWPTAKPPDLTQPRGGPGHVS